MTGNPVWIGKVTADGIPLTMFDDYNIVKGKLEIFIDLPPFTLVEVDYWHPSDPSGYTPGNLTWQEILSGGGMYRATAFTPEVGGNLTLTRNRYYWMEASPLGEIDFVRKSSGCMKIDIFDIVVAAGAYGAIATSTPNPKWIPAADVAPPSGVINIYDIVTIAGQYGREWDHPS